MSEEPLNQDASTPEPVFDPAILPMQMDYSEAVKASADSPLQKAFAVLLPEQGEQNNSPKIVNNPIQPAPYSKLNLGPKLPKPDGFDARELCGAPLSAKQPDGPRCTAKRGECNHCGAWCVRKGYPCPTPKYLSGRCKMHGGKSPKLQASPSWKNGKSSQYLPEGLRKRHQELMQNPELLSVRSEVATVELRIQELQEQLGGKTSRQIFDDITAAWENFRVAAAKGDKEGVAKWRAEIDKLLKTGTADYDKWDELIKVSKDKAQLARMEISSMVDMHAMISVEMVVVMLKMLGDKLRNKVGTVLDEHALCDITTDLAKILGK